MKKYPTGFRPADYRLGSYIFLTIGVLSIFLSIVLVASDNVSAPTFLFYFGVISIILCLYFFYIARKEK